MTMLASAGVRGEGVPLVLVLVVAGIFVALVAQQVWYGVLRMRSKRWPTVAAKVQQSAPGIVTFRHDRLGYDYTSPARFLGYAFSVAGVRYAGLFVLYGEETKVQQVARRLVGQPVQVRYDPARPDTSLLADYEDSRFQGLTASQRPDFLDEAPAGV